MVIPHVATSTKTSVLGTKLADDIGLIGAQIELSSRDVRSYDETTRYRATGCYPWPNTDLHYDELFLRPDTG